MKVIAIGYDKKMFDRSSAEFDRMRRCAEAVESLDMIIFTRSSEPYVTMSVTSTFTVHATASRFRVLALFKAIQIGWRVAKVRENVTVVTAQDPFETSLVGWLVARPIKALFNVQVHSDVFASPSWFKETPLNYLRYLFGMQVLKHADVIRVVSKRSKAAVERIVGVQKKEIRVLPVSTAVPQKNQAVSRTSHTDSFTFITAARLSVEKNIPLLLKAFATVYAKYPQVRLKIFGKGSEEAELQILAHALFGAVDNPVTFFGWTNDLYKELTAADVYVLSSNYEGWARVLIEALAAGLPIVTTDVGCVGEVVLHNEHALVAPVGDVDAFAAALEKIVSDKTVYTILQSNIAALDMNTIAGANLETYAVAWRESLV